ncbi:MAG: cytochrome o ubiquinol oxidase subunit IV [Brevundimonas sp.]|uniref:cytochrome o ubiquinol oxidase subunit IV n=1 Tax=Brevundimonas sp. TaxID=1871086 RepID=UPI0025C65A50|nr:cytochrome o ubiquinol oxidase subunit IV [Brevundimonas sp.]MBX3478676.1 cytochrome o ubiquinol oxidase subunit IV [Brevundimonas sp.]
MSAHDAGEARIKPRDYVVGFLLSVVLTAIPFWLVMSGTLAPTMTGILVTLFAIAQIIVHTIFFLHVNTRSEGGWTLLALVFTGIMVVIVILGSLWIMYHLHGNMMPMAPPPVPVAPAGAPAI